MKIAIVALTKEGKNLARRIAPYYPGHAELYIKEGYTVESGEHSFSNLTQLAQELFEKYNGIVFIMATGIVVRVIAPLIQHKAVDPAVVVLDEKGSFAISLLAGHLGGANLLAHRVARLIGATPVITTATDVQGRPAIDMIAQKLGLRIEPYANIKYVNAAIVNHEAVVIYTDIGKDMLSERCPELDIKDIYIEPLENYTCCAERYAAVAVITDRIMPCINKPVLFLRPRTLTVGIGCRRGIATAAILAAIQDACHKLGRSPGAIKSLSTAWVKADEEGILQAGEILRVPVKTWSKSELEEAINRYDLATSAYTLEKIGVGAVCEPAALLAASQGKVSLTKQSYNGITVAIAEESCPWWELDQEI